MQDYQEGLQDHLGEVKRRMFTTEAKWGKIAACFEKRANFPNCIGAIDGKHIRVVKPEKSGSRYFNYKNFLSIVLLAVADSDYQFLYVDMGSFGKDSDSYMFQKSDFSKH
jgi:hypothetical protein